MAYKTPEPPLEVFSDIGQQNVVRRIRERLDNLETVTQAQSAGPGRLAPAPPAAKLSVSVNQNVKGHAYIRVINPEFLIGKQNPTAAAIRHWLQASPMPQFNKGVTDFGISHQTYFDISELGSGTFYFRLRSTYDGQTFNGASQSGKVTIP
jgi:hypothetical protein